ncbi:21064_t:CDS:2 [Cetraspora pellucida]|uniref:21064_t:CDS:1 n=1 Tax=Cetraspora pellucida TaxID=1433469 RepID=A0A9N9GPC4_9GLOM|nr:21064_t:CDS:2 [Cetraspora pellucida]
MSLRNLFTSLNNVKKDFYTNICTYNNIIAFISIKVKLDKNLTNKY